MPLEAKENKTNTETSTVYCTVHNAVVTTFCKVPSPVKDGTVAVLLSADPLNIECLHAYMLDTEERLMYSRSCF